MKYSNICFRKIDLTNEIVSHQIIFPVKVR